MRVAVLLSSLAWAAGLRLPPAASGLHTTWSRRAVCTLPFVLPLAATAATASTPLSASRAFSVREYVLDLKAARRGLDELTPLLERREVKGYEEARFLLRKPPVNGVRKARQPYQTAPKPAPRNQGRPAARALPDPSSHINRQAASKLLIVLEGDKERLPAKTKDYENIKIAFGKLDDGCKIGIESAMTKTPATPDLLPVLDELKAGIDRLVSGLELPKPVVPEPAAVETPAAEAA